MNEMQMAPAVWKKKVVHEVIEYWINFGYLAFFLVAFIWSAAWSWPSIKSNTRITGSP